MSLGRYCYFFLKRNKCFSKAFKVFNSKITSPFGHCGSQISKQAYELLISRLSHSPLTFSRSEKKLFSKILFPKWDSIKAKCKTFHI